MASSADLVNKLSRLNKEHLIDIIINKKVPKGLTVSQEVRDFIETGGNNFPVQNDGENSQNIEDNLKTTSDFSPIILNCEVRVLKSELECCKRIIENLEKTINDKNVIIELLNNKNEHSNVESNVATSIKFSQPGKEKPRKEKILYKDILKGEKQKEELNLEIEQKGSDISLQLEKDENIKEDPFTIVKNKRKSKRSDKSIIGSGKGSKISIESAPLFHYFHICRLHPNLGEEDLMKHLSVNGFSDVKCSKLNSRRPEEYSSFKIGVPISKSKDFKNPDVWPEGVRINDFLYRLSMKKPAT